VRDGDLEAGEELVRRYTGPLMRYLQRLVGSEHVAEELLQQTWVSALDNLDRFNAAAGGSAFKGWVFRIATNKANDHWRSSGRERQAKQGLRLVMAEHGPPAGQSLEMAEEQERLRWAIEQLPQSQREVLLLRYYGEMKFVEIAELLGCPLNTALGRMHKAMIKLKQLMEEHE
jgi:RNA polymerase sigma-70 factor, ECF subfamily